MREGLGWVDGMMVVMMMMMMMMATEPLIG
jgi:cystathionine beta-lyase/cystathionine gamma-synthase